MDSTLVGPGVAALEPWDFGPSWERQALDLGFSRDDFHVLCANENVLGPSEKAMAAAQAALVDAHRYPAAYGEALRERLAERHDVHPSNIVLGNGSHELIELIIRVFVQPNETVVTAWPSFVVYRLAAQAANREVLTAPLRSHRYDLAAMAALVDTRTKVVFIANPNNPTGTYVRRRELNAFLDRIPPHVIVVIDEAYYEYATARDFPDGVSALRSRPRVAVLRTFSKIFGLAGLRIGYGVMDPLLARHINSVRQPFNTSVVAQAAALAALDDVGHLERCQRLVRTERKYLSSALRACGLEPIDSQANFMCVRCPFDAAELIEHLRQNGSLVRSLAGYDLPEHLRTTIGLRRHNQRLVERTEDFVRAASA